MDRINELENYQVIINKHIEEMNSDAWLLKHKKTGARIVLLSNDDDNKVFNIGFRTPVSDDTGVPHIIEHTVLCGSEKYPVKDPFMELVKGSLNTFLNAMTYPDKTVYPVASYNDRDFNNLMEVYADAVFKPNIDKDSKVFMQEGWHYELENKDSELIYNGIVYNEMKGVFSSLDGIVPRVILKSVFPDNGYNFESGGDPESIPDLTYENYLKFYKKYYHPSNSYIYLYGDMDMVERLEWLDKEYLSKYDYLEVDSKIKFQNPFTEMREVKTEYAIADSESEKDNTVLAANYVIGDNTDAELATAFQVLEYALMDMPGAPLKQALIDANIGKDVSGYYEDGVYQPVYSIIAKYANESDKEKFLNVIKDTLEKLVRNGIDKQSLLAGLNSLEFTTREADFGRIPKGLMWGLDIMTGWLYNDENPFAHIETNAIFKKLREKINTDYFEKLLEKYLLNNTHCSMVVMNPKRGLTEEKEKQLAKKLADKKNVMSEEEIEELINRTKELKKYQETPSTAEELKKIPLLKISDISTEPRPLISEEFEKDGIKLLYNEIFTNGIGYLDIVFNCADLPLKYIPYVGLLKYLLAFMDTDRSYTELNKDIDLNLGGLAFNTGLYVNDKTDEIIFNMEVHAKYMYDNLQKAIALTKEIILETKFDDVKRLKEILEELKSRLNKSIMRSGDSAARLRAMSYYSEPYYIREMVAGISFYKFVEELIENLEPKKDEIINTLKETVDFVFRKDHMMINYAGSRESFEKLEEEIISFRNDLKKERKFKSHFNGEKIKLEKKNEAFITSGQVQYVARVGSYNGSEEKQAFDGSFLVLANILRSEYLWNNVRVLGGAYGCNYSVGRSGSQFFTSYRDPNLEKTNEVYDGTYEYIKNFTADERELRKYIIGTISGMDTPLNASDRSSRELSNYYGGIDYEMLKKERLQVLNTSQEDIRKLAPLVKKALDENYLCVVGGKSAIQNAKHLFIETKELG